MATDRIADRCPACGHQTLFVASGGWLTCSWLKCPNPGVSAALEEAGVWVLNAAQLAHEVEEARHEAQAMRQERDREIAARVALERGLPVGVARFMRGGLA